MQHFSRLLDALLIYAIGWTGTQVYSLPERENTAARRRPPRWRWRLA